MEEVDTDITNLENSTTDNTNSIDAIQNVLGAKNVLRFDLDSIKQNNTSGTWSENVYTYQDLVLTINSDGSVLVNGTPSKTVVFYYAGKPWVGISDWFQDGVYTISGEHDGYILSQMGIDLFDLTNNITAINALSTDTGMLYKSHAYVMTLQFAINTTFNNLLIYPMIRPAGTDPTYVNYSMTNRELTNVVNKMSAPQYLACYGTPIYMVAKADTWKWAILIILPPDIVKNYRITASNAQIVFYTTLTVENVLIRSNGVAVVVSENLENYINKEAYAELHLEEL